MDREYIIKDTAKKYLKDNKITNRKIADQLGVTEGYISQIINRKITKISKLMAYAFCKAICLEYEIENLFDIM